MILSAAGVHHAGELVDDLRRELARRGEDSAGGQAPFGSSRSAIGTPKASVLPDPVGDFDEHVVAVEDVGDDQRLDGERRLDAALGQRTGHSLGHAETGKGG